MYKNWPLGASTKLEFDILVLSKTILMKKHSSNATKKRHSVKLAITEALKKSLGQEVTLSWPTMWTKKVAGILSYMDGVRVLFQLLPEPIINDTTV